ncbi:hypothetical protein BN903_86 [Halorubrum sp. AJ67]|nr:hypothetical protein BN903_86 [Halorubrum sp. AJ67]
MNYRTQTATVGARLRGRIAAEERRARESVGRSEAETD